VDTKITCVDVDHEHVDTEQMTWGVADWHVFGNPGGVMEKRAMHRVREILRLRWAVGRSVRQTAASGGRSRGVVSKTTSRATAVGLTWDAVCELSDAALDERIYGKPVAPKRGRPEPDPVRMHLELRRPGVTLELLHIEYKEAHPDGYQYTAFCNRYRKWARQGEAQGAP
jgi:hypothetical protein